MKTPEEIDNLAAEWSYGEPCEAFIAGFRAGLEMAAEVAEDYWCTDDAIEAIRTKAEELKRVFGLKDAELDSLRTALAEAQEENKRLCEELSRQTIDLGVVRNSGAQAVKCAVAKTEAAEKERDELRTQLSDEMDLNSELTTKIERLDAKWRDYESAMVAWRESKQAADVVIDELRAKLKVYQDANSKLNAEVEEYRDKFNNEAEMTIRLEAKFKTAEETLFDVAEQLGYPYGEVDSSVPLYKAIATLQTKLKAAEEVISAVLGHRDNYSGIITETAMFSALAKYEEGRK